MMAIVILAAALAMVLAETLLVFAIAQFVYKTTALSLRLRNLLFIILSYPGIYMAVGGWAGLAFPAPALLGIPYQIDVLITAQTDTQWLPLPLNALLSGVVQLPIILAEVGVWVAWMRLSYLLARQFTAKPMAMA